MKAQNMGPQKLQASGNQNHFMVLSLPLSSNDIVVIRVGCKLSTGALYAIRPADMEY